MDISRHPPGSREYKLALFGLRSTLQTSRRNNPRRHGYKVLYLSQYPALSGTLPLVSRWFGREVEVVYPQASYPVCVVKRGAIDAHFVSKVRVPVLPACPAACPFFACFTSLCFWVLSLGSRLACTRHCLAGGGKGWSPLVPVGQVSVGRDPVGQYAPCKAISPVSLALSGPNEFGATPAASKARERASQPSFTHHHGYGQGERGEGGRMADHTTSPRDRYRRAGRRTTGCVGYWWREGEKGVLGTIPGALSSCKPVQLVPTLPLPMGWVGQNSPFRWGCPSSGSKTGFSLECEGAG